MAIAPREALAIACVISFELTTLVLAHVHAVSGVDGMLGGVWAVIATTFVSLIGHLDVLDTLRAWMTSRSSVA